MLLTREELARELKVHTNTIDRMRKRGMPEMKDGKVVRFDLEDVKEWMKGD